ncbi:MAG: Spy/CpxP family protein refolding chaperone [Syntrophales bacterium]
MKKAKFSIPKLMMIVAVIALTTLMALSAMAHREMKVGYGYGPGNFADIAAERNLNLTAEQTAKIDALRAVHLKDIEPLQDRMLNKSRELRSMWLARTPDRVKIDVLQKEAQALRDELEEKLANYRQEVLQILTPEQQARIQASVTGRWMEHRGGGGGMAGGRGYGWGMR